MIAASDPDDPALMLLDVIHHNAQTFTRRNFGGWLLVFEGAQPLAERERRLAAFLARNGLTG